MRLARAESIHRSSHLFTKPYTYTYTGTHGIDWRASRSSSPVRRSPRPWPINRIDVSTAAPEHVERAPPVHVSA